MKDKTLTLKYARTDTGCLQIFIFKNGNFIENLTIFPDLTTWLDLNDSHKAPVHVYPDNALHRIWYQDICRDCGWKSEPHEYPSVGFGGTLDCPDCRANNRNGPFLEGCYGNVDSVLLDWETKKQLSTNANQPRSNKELTK